MTCEIDPRRVGSQVENLIVRCGSNLFAPASSTVGVILKEEGVFQVFVHNDSGDVSEASLCIGYDRKSQVIAAPSCGLNPIDCAGRGKFGDEDVFAAGDLDQLAHPLDPADHGIGPLLEVDPRTSRELRT